MRQLLLLSVLLLGGSWVAAQNYPSSGQTGSAHSAGSQTTVEGCLSGSDGKYMLTDKEGKTYDLAGDTSKLAEHVGHEVKITGTAGTGDASKGTAGGEMGKSSGSAELEVSSVKHVSKTCKSGGMSK